MTLRLRVEAGDESLAFVLEGQPALVGRGLECEIVLDHATISARHGIFRSTGAGHSYQDLGSLNGSALQPRGQGALVPLRGGETTAIGPGDVLVLAATDDPVRVIVEASTPIFDGVALPAETVVARVPVVSLLSDAPEPLMLLAGVAVVASRAEDLADALDRFGRALLPGASVRAEVVGPGSQARVGAEPPAALAGWARRVLGLEVVQRPTTEVALGLAVPLCHADTWHGFLLAWWKLAAPLAQPLLDAVALGASLAGLAASTLGVRRQAEMAAERLEKALRQQRERLAGGGPGEPLGTDPTFLEAVALARDLAPSRVPLVVRGATGTGKEVLARAVHRWSPRAAAPFTAVNCAAIPDTLLEGELFGHVRGAFTGAHEDRPGVFEQAHGGTLFLDEIGEMPLAMQAKLLRVLEDGEVRRVGAQKARAVDVRVVSATHRDLARLVEAGRFREDLLYRIAGAEVLLPSLAERPDDIVLLAHYFLERACQEHGGKAIPGFEPEAVWALLSHGWPGNLRELRNEVQRATALTPAGQSIAPRAFSDRLRAAAPAAVGGEVRTLRQHVELAERHAVRRALEHTQQNLSQAALELGLSRAGMYKLLERLGLGS